jgi:ribonucleoside-diphosphate reductase alpha chain
MSKLEELKLSGEAPEWLTEQGLSTLLEGYLLPNETPKGMYKRVSQAAAKNLRKPQLEDKFFSLIWNNWLCLATPVASNLGTDRALPISCFSEHIEDSVDGIFKGVHELAMLSKNGGGVGVYLGDVRSRGTGIRGNGKSEGIIPWAKNYDTATLSVSQGSTRRGASALWLPVRHGDIEEYLPIRRAHGDINRQCLNIHQGVCVDDKFMQDVENGDEYSRKIWTEICRTRLETGEPYLLFIDTVNRTNPECYIKNNLSVKTSNICSEIVLHTDIYNTFVCCLSSLNLVRWEEWKNTDCVYYAIMFLDAVMSEFIEKAKNIAGFERAVSFAEKSRALGLGVLGWHTLLQELNIPFDSFEGMMLNRDIFSYIQKESIRSSEDLAKEYGEPEWCKSSGRRNSHLNAVAPTATNSVISGNVSPGIEPNPANAFAMKTAKGTFIIYNPTLKKLLIKLGKDNSEVWKDIVNNEGSVQQLDFLNEHQKKVFLTAIEINQFALVRQAAQRQKWIDQSQSLNLFFPANVDPTYFHKVHMEAWKTGVKSLYYCRTSSVLKGDSSSRFNSADDCTSCES